MTSLRRAGRQVAYGVGGLVALDVAGGIVAIANDVNSPADAWGSKALLAAPWPMVGTQVLLARQARRPGGRGRTAAAGLLSAACLLSAASGFFDGGLGNPRVPERLAPIQWLLVAGTTVVGGLAARYAVMLARQRGTT